jgi:hypothetical protein
MQMQPMHQCNNSIACNQPYSGLKKSLNINQHKPNDNSKSHSDCNDDSTLRDTTQNKTTVSKEPRCSSPTPAWDRLHFQQPHNLCADVYSVHVQVAACAHVRVASLCHAVSFPQNINTSFPHPVSSQHTAPHPLRTPPCGQRHQATERHAAGLPGCVQATPTPAMHTLHIAHAKHPKKATARPTSTCIYTAQSLKAALQQVRA